MKSGLSAVEGLSCVRCGRELALKSAGYLCPCGGNLEVAFDYRRVKKALTRRTLKASSDPSIWRYEALLPVSGRRAHRPSVLIGGTPLYRAERLGRSLGLTRVFLKDDGKNPSGSFKDRAGAVAAARAKDLGRPIVAGASTGNAASSLACLAAAMGLETILFVPESAPAAKIAQLLVFGARVVAVKGTYDEAFDLCVKACERWGWYNRNTGMNAFTREGKKTCAFELVEQLGWKVPGTVFVPVGDGNILSGVWKGFKDFYALGLIDRLPRLAAVQASGSDAVKRAFESGGAIRAVSGRTIADSISVQVPRDGEAAVRALRESRGFAVSVSDAEILDALRETARLESVFAEPAAAASVAGLKKAAGKGLIGRGETVVALLTGNGLKDVEGARKAVGKPSAIRPDMAALEKLVKGFGRE